MGTCTKHDVSKRLCEAQKVSFFTVIITVIILLQNESQCFHFRTASNVECSQTEAVVVALPSTEEQCESHSVCLCTQLTLMRFIVCCIIIVINLDILMHHRPATPNGGGGGGGGGGGKGGFDNT